MKEKQLPKIPIVITSIFVIFISFAYAFLNQTLAGIKRQVITAAPLQLEFQEEKSITLGNALPIYDEVGMIQEPFTFELVNNSDRPLNYIVKLVDVTPEGIPKLDTNIVKYGFTKEDVNTIDFLSNLENSQLDSGMILSNQTISYSLRLWIDFDVEDEELIHGKSLSYRIDVEAGQVDGTERKLIFNADGGELSDTTKIAIVGDTYKDLPIPTKQGYNFLGWFNEEDKYVDENTILDAFTKELTAKWQANQYTVTFDPNGGTITLYNKQVNYDDIYGTLPSATKTDHAFLGWYTEKNGGEKIEENTKYTSETNQTLYARYEDEYKEEILNGAIPTLSSNLIPVEIASNGTVTKANINNAWYSYKNKIWANAVILSDKTVSYSNGQTIPESNIESYFVWIPSFKYKIFDTGNYSSLSTSTESRMKMIEVQFENKGITPSNGKTVDSWLSHPAFQAFSANGLWIGKFESGYKGAKTTQAAQVGIANASMLVIKPNTYSWRNMNIGNMFKTSYEYLREYESHMMKNTEWGAVTYLSHSQYGINNEVYINNNNTHITGCGGNSAGEAENSSCKNSYGSKTNNIYNQSTTGNISGIFDMSGGTHEYVMGYNTNASSIGGSSEITSLYGDFFTNSRWNKYYDKYSSSSSTSYSSRILGDATGEMGPFASYQSSWYNDYAYFVDPTSPWFTRGGGCVNKTGAGPFLFYYDNGANFIYTTFRVTLAL